jgi:two-component system response regulator MprA
VLAAGGGSAALAHMAAAGVDAMVLDVAMPEPNGLEVCRRLRARGGCDAVPVPAARQEPVSGRPAKGLAGPGGGWTH